MKKGALIGLIGVSKLRDGIIDTSKIVSGIHSTMPRG